MTINKENTHAAACSKCGYPYGSEGRPLVCPNCGNTMWGEIISIIVFGAVLALVFFVFTPSIASNAWRAIARWAFGLFAFFFLFGGGIGIISASTARKDILKKLARPASQASSAETLEKDSQEGSGR